MPATKIDIATSLKRARLRFETQEDIDLQKKVKSTKQTDEKYVKSQLKVSRALEAMFIVVVARAKSSSKNGILKIKGACGNPLGGYVFDSVHDCYVVKGVDHFALGYIPISFQVKSDSWSTHIPVPSRIVKRYLSNDQKSVLKSFLHTYNKEDYDLQFVQFVE